MTKQILAQIALACVSILIPLLSGCTALQVEQPASNQAPIGAGPTITLIGTYGIREELNHAGAVIMTGTALAEQAIATEVAKTQAAINVQNALVEQTRAADSATQTRAAVFAAATQQAEWNNAQATQHAISVNSTATAAEIALHGKVLEITQTAIVSTLEMGEAEIKFAEAEKAKIETDQAAKDAQQADIDRQTDYVLKLVVGVIVVAFFASLFLVVLMFGARWLSVIIAIDVRKRMIIKELGLQYDNAAGEWVMLPGYDYPVLPAPEPEPEHEIKIKGRVYTQEDLEDSDRVRQERAERTAWRNVAIAFLRWGEHKIDGKPIGYSRSNMTTHAGVSDPAWRTITGWLINMGFMYQPNGGATSLALDDSGESMTVSQILRSPKWATSYKYPKGEIPSVEPPKMQNFLDPTQPGRPGGTGGHRGAPANPPQDGPFVIENDENGKKTVRPYGARWSENNPPPRSYEDLMKDLGEA
jgi:hypothetical protein